MNFKKISSDAILTAIGVPVIMWILSFIFMAYETQGKVSDVVDDIREIKTDIKEIRNFLLNKGVRDGYQRNN